MLAVYVGIYICILAILWGFFLIARHHTYKFKRFSGNITPVTNILFVFLIILSIAGFFLLFSLEGEGRTVQVDTSKPNTQTYY